MELRRDLGLGPGIIAAACIGLAFISVGLFVRMSPAIRAILDENVASQEAAYDVVERLARNAVGPLDGPSGRAVLEAIARAEANVTIEGEVVVIAAMRQAAERLLAGDEGALPTLVDASRELTRLNQRAMHDADDAAAALGTAGAWTAVFGGTALLVLTLLVVGRLRRRIAEPVAELARVLEGARRGKRQLRCRPLRGAVEVEQALVATNELLDRLRELETARPRDAATPDLQEVLAALLTALDGPVAVLGRDGAILAANPAALDVLATDRGVALRSAAVASLAGAAGDAGDLAELGSLVPLAAGASLWRLAPAS